MSFFASLFTAFSMYSRLPVPRLEWKKEHLRYSIGLFPLVGVAIGLVEYGYLYLTGQFFPAVTGFPRAAFFALISILISGGIHLDGYLDTSDALSSFGEKEKRLQILSDPHIGSFAVIRLLTYYLILLGAYSLTEGKAAWSILCMSFFLSRILSGSASVWCQSATKEGTLFTFTDNAQKLSVRLILGVQLALCAGVMLFLSPLYGGAALVLNALLFAWWWMRIHSAFGGITGDTAGFLSTLSECATAAACAGVCLYQQAAFPML